MFIKKVYVIKLIIILAFLSSITYIIFNIYYINNNYETYFKKKIKKYNHKNIFDLSLEEKINSYNTNKFAIIRRLDCPNCGFFSFYIMHLGCVNKYLLKGYIPIIDLQSFKNAYNKGNTSFDNPWELFFNQAYNYTLNSIKKFAKNIKYLKCGGPLYRPDEINIYYNNKSINFWHNFANKYMPIKNDILNQVNDIMKKLFNDSKNILGVKLRGTDYLSRKEKRHSIQPKVEKVIYDVKIMDIQYKYNFIFFSTEDELIKKKFIPEFKDKIRFLNPNVIVKYDYNKKNKINLNEQIYGNIEYIKNYVMNIIILSKCLDIITSRCSGAAGLFVLTNGFRHIKVYDLGIYK